MSPDRITQFTDTSFGAIPHQIPRCLPSEAWQEPCLAKTCLLHEKPSHETWLVFLMGLATAVVQTNANQAQLLERTPVCFSPLYAKPSRGPKQGKGQCQRAKPKAVKTPTTLLSAVSAAKVTSKHTRGTSSWRNLLKHLNRMSKLKFFLV